MLNFDGEAYLVNLQTETLKWELRRDQESYGAFSLFLSILEGSKL